MNKTPILFVWHGSPMNAIESNVYTENWRKIWESIEKPRAILIFSAHWITEWQTLVSANQNPEMIYDMYGFPPELYRIRYNASWSKEIAEEIFSLLNNPKISLDLERWFDHGVWSTLIHIFPNADIPIITMSIDYLSSPRELYLLGNSLAILRDKWILIMWSGNIVHNLGAIDWSGKYTHPWAIDFDKKVANLIENREYESLFRFREWWDISRLAHPSYDHLLPLFLFLVRVRLKIWLIFLLLIS